MLIQICFIFQQSVRKELSFVEQVPVITAKNRGLHCLGDSSGWTRGLMMASVMGVLMGRKLAEKEGL